MKVKGSLQLPRNDRYRNNGHHTAISLGIALLVGLAFFATNALAQGTWTEKAPMPTPRADSQNGAVVNGIIYVFGGQNCAISTANNCDLPTVEAYDPATDTWTEKASIPSISGIGIIGVDVAAAINGTVYVYGRTPAGFAQPNFLAYDTSTDTWSFKSPIPTPRADSRGAVVNGILYVMGGFLDSNGRAVTTNEAYDPATDTWSEKAPMTVPDRSGAAAAINDIIYLVGGSNNNNDCLALSTAQAYDTATDTWASIAPMPTARFALGAGVVGGILYALGGDACSPQFATNEAYDPSGNTWSSEPPMPTARDALAVGVVNGTLYAIGGVSPAGVTGVTEAFAPTLTVSIEIKPPASAPVSINLSSAGVIPVAILSSPTFDATQVNQATISLSGSTVKLKGNNQYQCSVQDVNGDGLNDLLCQVVTDQTQLQAGATIATLTAQTLSGQAIQGQEAIQLVNQ